jgi:pyridoxine 5-phosphate synthase
MAKLSVNLNKIALLRNARHTGVPDLLHFGRIVHDAGARGITVHPRPDERHIRRDDVHELAALMAPWRPAFEYNIEGYPDARLMAMVRDVRPEQCTLVPDAPDTFTSDSGWRLDEAAFAIAAAAVAELRALGCRPILFMDPDPSLVARAAEAGAAGIEIYTGGYAHAFAQGAQAQLLAACAATARAAADLGLVVNVGHDLNRHNIPPLIAAAPMIAEASIGHELTADALEMGLAQAIAAYRRALGG